MSKEINLFEMVQAQFDHNAEKLNLDPALRAFMREPERQLQFTIPVDMDDGTTKTFTGSVSYTHLTLPTIYSV